MTLSEFLHNLSSDSLSDLCMGVLYHSGNVESTRCMQVKEIREALRDSGFLAKSRQNVSRALSNSIPKVHSPSSAGRTKSWELTPTGKTHVRGLISKDRAVEIRNDAAKLNRLRGKLSSDQTGYFEEAIKCFEADAMHAAVIFLWSAAIRAIHEDLLRNYKKNLQTYIIKHAPKAPAVRSVDHFGYVQDSAVLKVAEDVGAFDRNQRMELEKCLDLRNRCGHPGKYKPGLLKVLSFIEDIAVIVYKMDL